MGAVYAEHHKEKQQHLLHHCAPTVLCNKCEDLDYDSAYDIKSQQRRLLPACFFMDAGVPCVSRTPLSCQAKENVNCVQQGRSATGEAFTATRKVCPLDSVRTRLPSV